MKRRIVGGIIVIFTMILIVISCNSLFGTQFNEENVDKHVTISWSEVNLRAKPSTHSEIISSLMEGSSAELTGKTYEHMDGPYTSWCQIRLKDGTIGWVVTESID